MVAWATEIVPMEPNADADNREQQIRDDLQKLAAKIDNNTLTLDDVEYAPLPFINAHSTKILENIDALIDAAATIKEIENAYARLSLLMKASIDDQLYRPKRRYLIAVHTEKIKSYAEQTVSNGDYVEKATALRAVKMIDVSSLDDEQKIALQRLKAALVNNNNNVQPSAQNGRGTSTTAPTTSKTPGSTKTEKQNTIDKKDWASFFLSRNGLGASIALAALFYIGWRYHSSKNLAARKSIGTRANRR